MKINLTCQLCSTNFYVNPCCKNQKYCSAKCAKKSRSKSLEIRFWEKVKKSDNCWNWVGARNEQGYGIIAKDSAHHAVMERAHRVSWKLHNGYIPKGKWVLHKCDNPSCVNPSHLFLGNNSDNILDCVAKGRWNGYRKLKENQVKEIKKMLKAGIFQRIIGKKYGVTRQCIGDINTGKVWKKV